MKDLITVILNVYNDSKYIDRCVPGIINQTYKNLEIIIVNDGSTDDTLKKLKQYKDKRIKIITTKNQGLSLARNVGIDAATGKYLYFVDADDIIEEDAIEYLYKLIKKYKTPIATTDVKEIYSAEFERVEREEVVTIEPAIEMVKKILLGIGRNGTTWNKLFKRELFNKVRFEHRIVNDVVTTHKLYLEAKKIAYSNQVKYYYYRHKDSISIRRDYDRSVDMINAVFDRHIELKKKYPYLIESDACVLLVIQDLYYHGDEKLIKYLKNNNWLKVYNEIFRFKILKCNIRFNNKIKLILFRISPRLLKWTLVTYMQFKH